ncbi:hypothetical protein K432DRAFT_311606, partial [Lepidopterella palustris CBS 459.81]
NTLLLLDKANVYMRRQLLNSISNNLTATFLQKLKYYRGIIFLTTNRLKDFNKVILSRVYIALHYNTLGVDTRRRLWEKFLEKVANGKASLTRNEFDELAKAELNS